MRLAYEENNMQKAHFEGMYNSDTEEKAAVSMWGFNCVARDNYFGGDQVSRVEVNVKVKKAIKVDVTGEMKEKAGALEIDFV